VEDRAFTLELLRTNETEIAYLAGLFDGEGSVVIVWVGRQLALYGGLRIAIEMTTPEPLRFAQRIFGGKIYVTERYSPHKPLSHWSLCGAKASVFLRAVEPYLIVKHEKTNLALSFLAYGRTQSPRKRELAELITPRQTKNQNDIAR